MACEVHGDDCTPRWEAAWEKFKFAMEARFRDGHHRYGDKVFTKDPTELLGEILQEAEDIIGWGFILRVRLQELMRLAAEYYPYQRANDLLQSARGQSDKLIADNASLRAEVESLRKQLVIAESKS